MTHRFRRPLAPPDGPIAAATHPDPYPYYAKLTARRPLHCDGEGGLWIAASAATCRAVLSSELCGVRPAAEPVPAALLGTEVGELFQRLARMTDGPSHGPLKRALSGALGGLSAATIGAASERWARTLVAETRAASDPARLSELACRLPAAVLGTLLGLDDPTAAAVAGPVGDLAGALAPAATRAQVDRGADAAARLLDLAHTTLTAVRRDEVPPLLVVLAHTAASSPAGPALALANGIGFLTQAYDATAGLIGNTLVALARDPALSAQVAAAPELMPELVSEVARHDPPIQNTRRFMHRSGPVAGIELPADAVILVLLAAANRDPALNPEPDRLDLRRRARQSLTFGAGAHACPGAALAGGIAAAGVRELLARGLEPRCLVGRIRYRPSLNARIPLFDVETP